MSKIDITASMMLLISKDHVTIEIEDDISNTRFFSANIPAPQFMELLSRIACVKFPATVNNTERIGKIHECKTFVFEISKDLKSSKYTMPLNQIALRQLEYEGMSDWTPDNYYGSQSSFYSKGGKDYASVTIRRWIDSPTKTQTT